MYADKRKKESKRKRINAKQIFQIENEIFFKFCPYTRKCNLAEL